MYNSDTEILFPLRVVPSLADARSAEWQALTERISNPDASRAEKIGFVLMMIRLNGCIACNADSFRAMRGCTQCARQTLRRFRSPDKDLLELFEAAKVEAEQFLAKTTGSQFTR